MGSATSETRSAMHVTSVKLTTKEHADLKRIAAHERRSLSNQVRHMIALRAAELDAELKAAA